ncbi:MAG TPA: protease pro-enzyme activation domain-containing protein [Bryobacteraceae bacterium]|nr:protease pro-enzyme activation domain-containing protein [Bryobacteraceae bacterium]
MSRNSICFCALLLSAVLLTAAPPSRITRPVDPSRTVAAPGRVHHLAQAQYDKGAIDPKKQLNYMVMLVKPSAAQQAELDALLVDQQNPSSKNFRQWLTPEQFGGRFGLNSSDQSKVVAWLTAQGFAVDHVARSNNWVAFSGSAAQVTSALHTAIHQFEVNGRMHFANTQAPAVPEALSDVVGGFLGLNDFPAQSNANVVTPDYTTGNTHYLTPADWATIYDVNPLYAAGIDGTGQSIAIVGESDVLLSDIAAFRTRYGLPANVPKLVPFGTDPGYNGAEVEGNLDLEWAGAIAPKATIYYVYGTSAFTAMEVAVESAFAPVVSVSYSSCEINADFPGWSSLAQQGNAQGITILAASGDAGAAGCDFQGSEPFATRGLSVNFPAVLPEVTAVGGTQFVEGTGTYWGATNSSTFGSALSYIPEAAWNESSTVGLLSTGGGASRLYAQPAWQTGPGVPSDGFRHVPDVSFSAAGHDAYFITYLNSNVLVSGTSCATPAMAAVVALLNQYLTPKGVLKNTGLGNINPQLYRMAHAVPTAFHDVTAGNNMVQCSQGSPDCLTGSLGYSAGAAYDMTTGLGSIDTNVLVTQWNTAVDGSVVTLTLSSAKATLNDTVQLTAAVTPATGSGTPTGTVNFTWDTIPLGSATLVNGSATVSVPLYTIGFATTALIAAEYSGDAAFSSSGATKSIQVTTPTGVASVIPSAPTTVYPQYPDAQGLSWQTSISLIEVAGTPALLTGLTIDGVAQTLSQYFPSTAIQPKGTLTATFVFRGLAPPVTKTFVFTGTDPTGLIWSRQVAVNYLSLPTDFYGNVNATPLTAVQNPANSACPWSVQLNVDDQGGYGIYLISYLLVGGVDMSKQVSSIFGTTRIDAWGGLQGTLCFSNITPPATDAIYLQLSNGAFESVSVSFAPPPANPGTLSTTPAAVSMAAASQPATTKLTVNLSDKTQQWSATVFPMNRTTSWLSASQLSGTGSGTITLTANGAGFEPGAYRATIVFQSLNAVPQYINVPVMFLLGGSTTGTTITAVANAASYKTAVSPGMLLGVFGTGLANSTAIASGNPLNYSLAGVSAFVNGLGAPVTYASPNFLTIQVPFAAGAGPAVLSVNNNGQIAGFSFQISPASPGVFADAGGNVVPIPAVKAGTALALYVTGTGEVTPALKTAYSPAAGTALANLPAPILPVSVTVGGAPAFVEFAGITPGLLGVTQVNILVPASTPTGNQPVVVTVGGAASAAVNIVVQ